MEVMTRKEMGVRIREIISGVTVEQLKVVESRPGADQKYEGDGCIMQRLLGVYGLVSARSDEIVPLDRTDYAMLIRANDQAVIVNKMSHLQGVVDMLWPAEVTSDAS